METWMKDGKIAATERDLEVLSVKRPAKKWRNKYTFRKDVWTMCCSYCIVVEETTTTTTLFGCGIFPTAELAEQRAMENTFGRPGVQYHGPFPCGEDGSPL